MEKLSIDELTVDKLIVREQVSTARGATKAAVSRRFAYHERVT
jgi:hypothetical protein